MDVGVMVKAGTMVQDALWSYGRTAGDGARRLASGEQRCHRCRVCSLRADWKPL